MCIDEVRHLSAFLIQWCGHRLLCWCPAI
jgi:hypothetical protein